jgi:hypothetical protein
VHLDRCQSVSPCLSGLALQRCNSCACAWHCFTLRAKCWRIDSISYIFASLRHVVLAARLYPLHGVTPVDCCHKPFTPCFTPTVLNCFSCIAGLTWPRPARTGLCLTFSLCLGVCGCVCVRDLVCAPSLCLLNLSLDAFPCD